MNKIISVLLMLLVTNYVTAQKTSFVVEQQNYYSKERPQPLGSIEANHYFKDSKWGVWSFALVDKTWGEIYIGPTYSLLSANKKRYGESGIAYGIETDKNSHRFSMYQFYEHYTDSSAADQHKLTCLLNVEYGGSGYWYLGFLNYNVSTHVGIGIHSQYGGDWGPRLQFNFPIGNVWLSAGYNLEDRVVAGLSGVRLIF